MHDTNSIKEGALVSQVHVRSIQPAVHSAKTTRNEDGKEFPSAMYREGARCMYSSGMHALYQSGFSVDRANRPRRNIPGCSI